MDQLSEEPTLYLFARSSNPPAAFAPTPFFKGGASVSERNELPPLTKGAANKESGGFCVSVTVRRQINQLIHKLEPIDL